MKKTQQITPFFFSNFSKNYSISIIFQKKSLSFEIKLTFLQGLSFINPSVRTR